MSANAIGELFVSLGFDVDDSKLKAFNDGIKEANNGMLKLSAGAIGAVTSLGIFMEGAAQKATAMRNFALETNQSTDALQKWISVARQTNAAVGYDQGASQFQHATEYLTAAMTGRGSAAALNMLGVRYYRGMSTEEMIKGVITALPGAQARYPAALTTQYLQEIFGDKDAAASLLKLSGKPEMYDRLGASGVVSEKELRDLDTFNQAINDASLALGTFRMHIASALGAELPDAIKAIKDAADYVRNPNDLSKYNGVQDYLSRRGTGMALYDALRLGVPIVGGGVKDTLEEGAGIAWKGLKSIFGGSDPIAQKQGPKAMLMGMGWTEAQANGIMRRLQVESGMNPGIYGHGAEARGLPGEAYGIGQWHADRQANFKRWSGHDIHGSSTEEQIAFLNWEMTRGLEQKAGRSLRGAKTDQAAYDIFTNEYERPKGAITIIQHINSSAPAKDVAAESNRLLQSQLNATQSQTNRGPNY